MSSTAVFDGYYSLPDGFLEHYKTGSSLGENSESRGIRIRPHPGADPGSGHTSKHLQEHLGKNQEQIREETSAAT